jgi:hypothetical protein
MMVPSFFTPSVIQTMSIRRFRALIIWRCSTQGRVTAQWQVYQRALRFAPGSGSRCRLVLRRLALVA